LGVQPGVADQQRCIVTVGEEVDRVDLGAPGERFADLIDPRAIHIQEDDLENSLSVGLRGQVREQLIGVRHARVDEHQLVGGCRGSRDCAVARTRLRVCRSLRSQSDNVCER